MSLGFAGEKRLAGALAKLQKKRQAGSRDDQNAQSGRRGETTEIAKMGGKNGFAR